MKLGRDIGTAMVAALVTAAAGGTASADAADAAKQEAAAVAVFAVTGDGIDAALGGLRGDAGRGRRVVLDRTAGNCLICHVVPEPDERFMGNVGPSLTGVGKTLSAAQLRLRVVDSSQVNPKTIMPPYHRVEGLNRVAPQFSRRPALTAQEIEDVVAYLVSLQ